MYRTLAFLAILSAAMLVGLMTTLLTVMRGLWNQQPELDAARNFQDFLQHAGTNRVLSTLTIIPSSAASGWRSCTRPIPPPRSVR
ncbi:hypothetical protein ABIA39_007415 [Nocardia sp. GAS34]|uniref:hypothetical protein n=1 Tax=unclassified Nocardia TaxID=2637762 RepID=UPI003D1FD5D0